MDWIQEMLGELIRELLVPALLLLVLLVFAIPVYFVLKKLSGRKTTFPEDLWRAPVQRPAAAPRNQFVKELEDVRSGLQTVGVYLVCGAIVLVTGFIFYFFATLKDDANKAFVQFYFGVGYLVFMLFAVGMVFELKYGRGARRRRAQSRRPPGHSGSHHASPPECDHPPRKPRTVVARRTADTLDKRTCGEATPVAGP